MKKFGVWVNGKLAFSNSDITVATGYAEIQMRKFSNNVWVARIGSISPPFLEDY